MPRVPSRQTYLASLGLAWLVATAFERIRPEFPRLSAIAMAAMLLINGEILWVKKLVQFRERAEPTELLRSAARHASGPIHIAEIPVDAMVARAALARGRPPHRHRRSAPETERRASFLYLVHRSKWRGKSRGYSHRDRAPQLALVSGLFLPDLFTCVYLRLKGSKVNVEPKDRHFRSQASQINLEAAIPLFISDLSSSMACTSVKSGTDHAVA